VDDGEDEGGGTDRQNIPYSTFIFYFPHFTCSSLKKESKNKQPRKRKLLRTTSMRGQIGCPGKEMVRKEIATEKERDRCMLIVVSTGVACIGPALRRFGRHDIK
jgi:hypothetical protein